MIEDGIKISELTTTSTINNEDLIPIVQGEETKSITRGDLLANIDNIGDIYEYTLSRKTSTLSGGSWQEMTSTLTTGSIPAGTYLVLFRGTIGGTTSAVNILSVEPWIDNYGTSFQRLTIPYTNLTSAFEVWRIYTPQTDGTHTLTVKGWGSSSFNVSSDIVVDWFKLK